MFIYTEGGKHHKPAAVQVAGDEAWGVEAVLNDDETHYCVMLSLNTSGDTYCLYAEPADAPEKHTIVDGVVRRLINAKVMKSDNFSVDDAVNLITT